MNAAVRFVVVVAVAFNAGGVFIETKCRVKIDRCDLFALFILDDDGKRGKGAIFQSVEGAGKLVFCYGLIGVSVALDFFAGDIVVAVCLCFAF